LPAFVQCSLTCQPACFDQAGAILSDLETALAGIRCSVFAQACCLRLR
jgi:hypothetical protein